MDSTEQKNKVMNELEEEKYHMNIIAYFMGGLFAITNASSVLAQNTVMNEAPKTGYFWFWFCVLTTFVFCLF